MANIYLCQRNYQAQTSSISCIYSKDHMVSGQTSHYKMIYEGTCADADMDNVVEGECEQAATELRQTYTSFRKGVPFVPMGCAIEPSLGVLWYGNGMQITEFDQDFQGICKFRKGTGAVYTQVDKSQCYADKYDVYNSVLEGKAACDKDP